MQMLKIMRQTFWLGVVFLFMWIADAAGQTIVAEFNSSWRFRKTGDKEWMPATVPGTVHTDLFDNKKIPDPFFGENEKQLQWIDTCSWEYELWFNADEQMIREYKCELLFEGIDTYAKVYLNDSLVLSANNMFRSWTADCKKLLKPEQNHLLVRFEPALKYSQQEQKKLKYTLPGDEKVFTRKAQYQYGWDWGPRFITCGLWRPVKIIFWNNFRLRDVQVVTGRLTDTLAAVELHVNVHADNPTTMYYKVILEGSRRDSFYFEQLIYGGDSMVVLPVSIRNPERWHSNGNGRAALYKFTVEARTPLSPTQSLTTTAGLRKVELVQEKQAKGTGFYFLENGQPVFMKGANWIPADNFLPRVSHHKYSELLIAAKDANMNMLRVWGGGIYEDDYFYDLCDSLGILVWQDFMFACSMYPGDAAFLANVKNEVRDNVIRLRNHPCIALWCGNNEIDEGWKNWGWQKQYHYSAEDSAKVWKDYLKLFHRQIPDQLAALDPSRPYWESSPSTGWGRDESLTHGDVHYWGVWWGNEPFEKYKSKTGRFMSEYGFQGMPSSQAINSFTDPADRNLQSASMKSHQKHPVGYETIDHYMKDWYKDPKDFESYRYVSQLLQAEGMRTAIEAHRRAKPTCMGSLYWQLNDCWPVTSWSSIDYTGSWKALHYAAKESFRNYLISVDDTGKFLNIYIVKEDTGLRKATLMILVEDFSGSVLRKDSAFAYLAPDRATLVYKTELENYPVLYNLSRTFLKLELRDHNQLLSSSVYYFKKPKDLLLDKASVQSAVQKDGEKYSVTLSCKTLAKNVFLDIEGSNVHFSENYFDLLPGEIKTVFFDSVLSQEELTKRLSIRSLSDAFQE